MWKPRRLFGESVPAWLRVWAVLYRLCWRSLGGRAHRTWSRRGNRRWRGSKEGGSLVAHSPAVEANRRDSLGLWIPPPGCRTGDSRVSVVTQQGGIIKGKYCGKDQRVVPKGSNAIHAQMRCFYHAAHPDPFCPVCADRARH